jgi:hypothetical protein
MKAGDSEDKCNEERGFANRLLGVSFERKMLPSNVAGAGFGAYNSFPALAGAISFGARFGTVESTSKGCCPWPTGG